MAAVTKPKSTPDQVEDLLRRLLAGMASPVPVPAPVPEVPMVEKLLQRLVAETQGGGGGEFATRISSKIQPQDPLGGVVWIATSRG